MGIADRDDELADAKRLRISKLGRGEPDAVGANDREIGERIAAGDGEPEVAAVGEPGGAARAPGDDVSGGEDEAVVGDHDAATRSGLHPPAPRLALNPEARDRGSEPLGNRGNGARVGVERLLVGRRLVERSVEDGGAGVPRGTRAVDQPQRWHSRSVASGPRRPSRAIIDPALASGRP